MSFTRIAALVLVTMGIATSALGQTYPSRPIRILHGFGPGGPTDVNARRLAAPMGKILGQSIVVEARPGAAGAIGTRAAAASPPDGYTITFGSVIGIHPVFIKSDFIDMSKEMLPISSVANAAWFIFSRGDLKVSSLKELVDYAKANPAKLNFGGTAAATDLFMEMVKKSVGDFPYASVRYRGDEQIMTALLGGQIDFAATGVILMLPHVRAGKMNALFASEKSSLLPAAPTPADLGLPSMSAANFDMGFWAPLGTPRDIIQKLNAAAVETARMPEIVEYFRGVGYEVIASSPEEQLRIYNSQVAFWREAARLANYQPQ